MNIPELGEEANSTFEARLATDPRLNALEIAVLDLILISTLDRITDLIAHLDTPGHDPDVALAAIVALTDLGDHITTELLHVEAVLKQAAGLIDQPSDADAPS